MSVSIKLGDKFVDIFGDIYIVVCFKRNLRRTLSGQSVLRSYALVRIYEGSHDCGQKMILLSKLRDNIAAGTLKRYGQ